MAIEQTKAPNSLEKMISDLNGLSQGTLVEIGVIRTTSPIQSAVRDKILTHFLYASLPETGLTELVPASVHKIQDFYDRLNGALKQTKVVVLNGKYEYP